jgi:hypothetical protein
MNDEFRRGDSSPFWASLPHVEKAPLGRRRARPATTRRDDARLVTVGTAKAPGREQSPPGFRQRHEPVARDR